jgi:hypothetical protein
MRARRLKIVLVLEIILAIWVLFLGATMLPILIIVPTNIIGFYGAVQLRRNLLTVFSFLKTMVFVMVVFALTDYALLWSNCTNCGSQHGQIPIITIILVLVGITQLLCIVVANRIRRAIIAAEAMPHGNVELGHVDVTPSSENQEHPQAVPVYPYPQYAPYPMPFPPQNGQGFPVYAAYPYPAGAPGSPQPAMQAVFPTYMYPGAAEPVAPTYTIPQEAAAPSNSDSDSLLQNVNLNEK